MRSNLVLIILDILLSFSDLHLQLRLQRRIIVLHTTSADIQYMVFLR